MQQWNINHPNIVSVLEELGVETPSDIVDLKPGDVEELISNTGLKTIEANRFKKEYSKMVAARLPQQRQTRDTIHQNQPTPTQCPEWSAGIMGLAYLASGIYVTVIASGKSEAASEPCKSLDNQLLPHAEANVRLC